MPDTTAPLLWFLAAATACLGLLVSQTSPASRALPNVFEVPWWQDIAAHYGLLESHLADTTLRIEDCVAISAYGEGFHRRVQYELLCSQDAFWSGVDTPGQVTVLQPLPPDLFADPYELSQTKAVVTGDVEIVPFGLFDLEQPAPACHTTVLGLTLRNVSRAPVQRGGRSVYHTFEVPFHAKYPQPEAQGEGCSADMRDLFKPGPTHITTWVPPFLLIRADSKGSSTPAGDEEGPPNDHRTLGARTLASVPGPASAAQTKETATSRQPMRPMQLPAGGQGHRAEESQEQEPQQQERQGQRRAGGSGPGQGRSRAAQPAGLWSMEAVRLRAPPSVVVPGGCMLHAALMSGVTLAAAVACSAAIVLAAVC